MMIEPEQKIIESQFKILSAEKRPMFSNIWNQFKASMGEKLNNENCLLEIFIRCCSFLAACGAENEDEQRPNQMEKFMTIEKENRQNFNADLFRVPNIHVPHHVHDRVLNLNDFMKQMTKIMEELTNKDDFKVSIEIIKDFSFSRTLFKKCGDLMNLFFDSHCLYFQKVKDLIWSLFILCRKKIINNSRNILECLPMLIGTISLVLGDIDPEKFPQNLLKSAENEILEETYSSSNSEENSLLRMKLSDLILGKLISKTMDHTELSQYQNIKKLIREMISSEKNLESFMTNPEESQYRIILKEEDNINNISGMTQVLQFLYQNCLRLKHFDERIFMIKENKPDCSPMKFTPFKRQKITNSSENNLNNFSIPRRKITFEQPNPRTGEVISVTGQTNGDFSMVTASTHGNGMKMFGDPLKDIDIKELSKKISESVKMTPCTRVIVMDKWVKDYIRNWDNQKLVKYENLVFVNINTITSETSEKSQNNCSNLRIQSVISENLSLIQKLFSTYMINNLITKFDEIEKLILKIIFTLISRDDRIFGSKIAAQVLKNVNFIKSVIVVAVEIILFIENVELICFYKLANAIKLDLYEFWKILNPFIRVDLTIPSDIRLHFQEIELQLSSFMIFKKPSQEFKLEVEDFLKNYVIYLIDNNLKKVENMEFNNQSLFMYQEMSIFKNENLKDYLNSSNYDENQNNCSNIKVDMNLNINLNNNFSSPNFNTIVNSKPTFENLQLYQSLKSIYIFLRRILNYGIYLNKKISENLKLSKEVAKECEDLFKKILTSREYFEVIYDKHIDQVIVCCIIAIIKERGLEEKINYLSVIEAFENSKPDDSRENINSLFKRISISGRDFMNIIEFYNLFFISKVQNLVKLLCNDEEEMDMLRVRRRKFSLPDEDIRRTQFEEESAFANNFVMYEPLKKTVFIDDNNSRSKISGTSHLLISKSNVMAYSTNCSPMLSRSVNSSSMNRTPRTKRVKDVYADYISDIIVFPGPGYGSLHNSSGQQNSLKKKIRSNLSMSKLNFSSFDSNDVFSSFPSGSLDFERRPSDDFSLSRKESQSTPDFTKGKNNFEKVMG